MLSNHYTHIDRYMIELALNEMISKVYRWRKYNFCRLFSDYSDVKKFQSLWHLNLICQTHKMSKI